MEKKEAGTVLVSFNQAILFIKTNKYLRFICRASVLFNDKIPKFATQN